MTTPGPRGLHDLQLELECKGIVDGDRLVRIPGAEPDDIEGMQIVRYADGSHRALFAADVDDELRARVARVGVDAAFERPELLGVSRSKRLRSYVFPDALLPPTNVLEVAAVRDPDNVEPWMLRPVYEIHFDGRCVSYCRSSRENDRCAEAWVETDPAYRRRGFARDVVVAWACAARANGKVAFYSHDEDNASSAAVARSLGLKPFMDYVNLEVPGGRPARFR
jgi:RimJ/RimL family protein N-acetyltransferase